MGALTIDLRDRRPIYEQLIDQVVTLVLHGVMLPDEQLPSVRALAGELAINPNTIQKAYAELERRGITYSVPGRGSFVNPNAAALRQIHQDRLLGAAEELLVEARAIGMQAVQFTALIARIWKEDDTL